MYFIISSGVDSVHTHTHVNKIQQSKVIFIVVYNQRVQFSNEKWNIKQEITQHLQSNVFYFRGNVKKSSNFDCSLQKRFKSQGVTTVSTKSINKLLLVLYFRKKNWHSQIICKVQQTQQSLRKKKSDHQKLQIIKNRSDCYFTRILEQTSFVLKEVKHLFL